MQCIIRLPGFIQEVPSQSVRQQIRPSSHFLLAPHCRGSCIKHIGFWLNVGQRLSNSLGIIVSSTGSTGRGSGFGSGIGSTGITGGKGMGSIGSGFTSD